MFDIRTYIPDSSSIPLAAHFQSETGTRASYILVYRHATDTMTVRNPVAYKGHATKSVSRYIEEHETNLFSLPHVIQQAYSLVQGTDLQPSKERI